MVDRRSDVASQKENTFLFMGNGAILSHSFRLRCLRCGSANGKFLFDSFTIQEDI